MPEDRLDIMLEYVALVAMLVGIAALVLGSLS